jgi:hypothetical protein
VTVAASDLALGVAIALPWILVPVLGAWRATHSTSLDEEPETLPDDPPLVSIVVPARDEARNIARCVSSIIGTRYPRVEIIVVDDHSTDATASVVRSIANDDPRVRVLAAPDLPAGWFGKPWACATGARAAAGAILCFTDADTVHAPDLLPRVVHALRRRDVAMLSVAGVQELGTFWETVLQPQVFAMLSLRYGGTETVNGSPHAYDKIANGQYIVITRAAYDAVGGHESVRGAVAEDLMLAQRVFGAGIAEAIVLGTAQLSTRMYTSLDEVVRGWRKNIFAGGVEALPKHPVVRAVFPFALLLFPVLQLVPVLALAAAASGSLWPDGAALVWSVIATTVALISWMLLYRRVGRSAWYAFVSPLGAAVFTWIILGAIARGRRVAWKGREYRAA